MSWGILGFSRASLEFYISLREQDRQNAILYTNNPESAQERAKTLNPALPSLTILAKDQIKTHSHYFIGSQSKDHHEDILRLKELPGAILVEKPMVSDLSQFNNLPEDFKGRLVENLWLAHHPVLGEVRKWLPRLGQIQLVQLDMGIKLNEKDWRWEDGGVLQDLGVYPLHFLKLIGWPVENSLHVNGMQPTGSGAGEFYLELYSKAGQLARIQLSFYEFSKWECHVRGENGSLTIHPNLWDTQSMIVEIKGSKPQKIPLPKVNLREISLQGFLEISRDAQKIGQSLQNSQWVIEQVDRIQFLLDPARD